MANKNLHKVFVDTGTSCNLLVYSTFKKMKLLDKDLDPVNASIYDIMGDSMRAKWMIRLPITLGAEQKTAMSMENFIVVDTGAKHNAILGRSTLWEMRVVISLSPLTMKFPTPEGVGGWRGS